MPYPTSRFGMIDIPEDKIIQFPFGVIGFEQHKRFIMLKHKPESSFFWLQSLDNPDLAFSMLFPFQFIPNYEPEISEEDRIKLLAKDKNELEIYCMVVIPKDVQQMTINLLSPVVINSKTQLGIQTVLLDSDYSVHHPLLSNPQSGKKES